MSAALDLSDPDDLLPGAWVGCVQRVLDRLGELATLEEVVARFGTSRALTEAVLGHPTSGGTATRRAIRLVGQLCRHRLGPALATEALSWAASIAPEVGVPGVESFLADALHSGSTYRPLILAERDVLVAHVAGAPPHKRTETLAELWWTCGGLRSRWDLRLGAESYEGMMDRLGIRSEGSGACYGYALEDLAADWHAALSTDGSWERPEREVDLGSVRDLDGPDQVAWYEGLSPPDQIAVAHHGDLFDLADAVVAQVLSTRPSCLLHHPDCPGGLVQRIRYPYDTATVTLAVRAGRLHYCATRTSRTLGSLDDGDLADLIEANPTEVLDLLEEAGLLRASIDRGHPGIAAAAIRRLPSDQLGADDADAAVATGDRRLTATCPGVAGRDRPISPVLPVNDPTWWFGDDPIESEPVGVITYPAEIEALDGSVVPGYPQWTVRLPDTYEALYRNGRRMRNCTAEYGPLIRGGTAFIVMIDAPARRLNAAFFPDGDRWRCSGVSGRHNAPVLDAGLVTAIGEVAAGAHRNTGVDPPEPPVRRSRQPRYPLRRRAKSRGQGRRRNGRRVRPRARGCLNLR